MPSQGVCKKIANNNTREIRDLVSSSNDQLIEHGAKICKDLHLDKKTCEGDACSVFITGTRKCGVHHAGTIHVHPKDIPQLVSVFSETDMQVARYDKGIMCLGYDGSDTNHVKCIDPLPYNKKNTRLLREYRNLSDDIISKGYKVLNVKKLPDSASDAKINKVEDEIFKQMFQRNDILTRRYVKLGNKLINMNSCTVKF